MTNEEFDYFIKSILVKIFDIYYKDRNGFQSYNIDNVFKKYDINMYNSLKEKYKLTNSKKLIFKKHKYDKREYIMFLLKKNNFILNEDENEDYIINKLLRTLKFTVILNSSKIFVMIDLKIIIKIQQ